MKNILDNDEVIKDSNAPIQPIPSLEKKISAAHQGINITKKKPLSLEKNNLQAPVALVKEQKVAEVEELEKPLRNQAINNVTSENAKTEKSSIVKLFSLIFFILKWFCIVFVVIALIIMFVAIFDENKSTSSDPAQIETPAPIEPQQVSVAPSVQPIAPTENTSQIQQEREELAKYKAKDVLDKATQKIDVVWNTTTQKIRDAILPEQDEWLKKRENDCGLKASSEEPNNSVLQETIKFSCMAAMTDQRAEELKQEIASLQRFDNNAQTSTRAEPVSVDKPVENTNSANAITTKQKSTDRYQLNSDLVTDTQTGLMWMRCGLGQNWDGSTCKGEAATYTWKKAINMADKFIYAGYSDWRLPSVQELKTLVYCSSGQPVKWNEFIGETEYDGCNGQYNSPTVIQDVFPTTPATWEWSSTPNDTDTNRAWAVNFGKGSAPRNGDKTGAVPVRLVRTERVTTDAPTTESSENNQPTASQKVPDNSQSQEETNIKAQNKLDAANSVYTSLEEKSCKILESHDDEGGGFISSCPGHAGYQIQIEGGDTRSWLIILKNKRPVYDSQTDFLKHPTGNFAAIGRKVLEWRYDNAKKLIGLIVRVVAQDKSESPKEISDLFVFRHDNGQFCYAGTHKTNEGAREIADSQTGCKP